MMNKIVVLGKENSLYTKMVVHYLSKCCIDFDLILESARPNKKKFTVPILSKLILLLNSGAFKPLSLFHWFTWFLLFDRIKNKNNSVLIEISKKYIDTLLNPCLVVSSINDAKTVTFLEKQSYDYALFAGVGIVKGYVIDLINKSCLNSHPAPLPDCRGGGALECTLYKGLKPSVSVHIATEGIDEGDIFSVKELKLERNDNFITITHKLTELCAKELVGVFKRLVDQENILLAPNSGELNYWRDWMVEKQIHARRELKLLLRDTEC